MSTELPYGRNFWMARHTETYDNRDGVVSGGASKTIITEEGKGKAISSQNILNQIDPPINRIVTSEMQRTKDTAKFLTDNDSLRHLPHSTHSGINERHYGEAEGMSDAKRANIKKSGKKIEGEEPKDAQAARTIGAIAENLREHDGVPLFVTHGGNIRRVLEHTLGENVAKREYVTNCTFYEFIAPKEKGEGWKVNVLEMDDNNKVKRHSFGETQSKVSRLVRDERQIGINL